MKAIVRKCRIVCPESIYNGKTRDILIENGIIIKIDDQIEANDAIEISSENLHASIGWVDLFSTIPDPGAEQRETIESGAHAAAAGGFTSVFITPNTKPSISTKSQVEYVLKQNKHLPAEILPIGCISKNAEGKELAEMYDMHNSGALVFSDGCNPVQNPNLMIKALQYATANDTLLIQVPDEHNISSHGLINEGLMSTKMGLPGKPSIAEELMISRDIELLRYTESKLHITGISTASGLEKIRKAKQEGLNITCSVTPYHLYFCEDDLDTYDTHLKVNPPLRTTSDREALRKGLLDGTIDCITSHHQPLHWDDTNCEFEYAKYGMNGWETCFSAIVGSVGYTDEWIEKLTTNPRRISKLSIPEIKEGSIACLTLFDPEVSVVYTEEKLKSLSKNSAFLNKSLKGKVICTIHNHTINLNP
jgi:dihydroorotase